MTTNYLDISRAALTATDYGDYYERYIKLHAPDLLLHEALDPQSAVLTRVLDGMSDSDALQRYEPGKWSIKEVIMHLIDTERIFNYRALRYARKDKTPLAGFDHNQYAVDAGADDIALADLLGMFDLQRRNTQAMFQGNIMSTY